MKVLLDTCVLAELRRPEGYPGVQAAVTELADDDLFLSVLTVGEITKGISLLASGKKKRSLTSWLNGLAARFGDRILGIDLETARLWGELTARTTQGDHHPGRRRVAFGHRAPVRSARHDPQYPALRGEWGARHRPLAGRERFALSGRKPNRARIRPTPPSLPSLPPAPGQASAPRAASAHAERSSYSVVVGQGRTS